VVSSAVPDEARRADLVVTVVSDADAVKAIAIDHRLDRNDRREATKRCLPMATIRRATESVTKWPRSRGSVGQWAAVRRLKGT
jgi:hypothetical protein